LSRARHSRRVSSASFSAPRELSALTRSSDDWRVLVRFIVSGFAIWIASPVMSIVDTAVVGLGSTAELAALGPATALSDSSAYAFTWLGVATTSLVARALATGRAEDAERFVAEALTLAFLLACTLGVVLCTYGTQLLSLWTGSGDSAALIQPAFVYVTIRTLGLPAAFITTVAQSAFLAAKQPSVPLVTICSAAVTNLVGDLVLCSYFGMGLAGAAWATVISQLVAACIIVRRLTQPVAPGEMPLLVTLPSLLPSPESLFRFLRIGGPVAVLIGIKVILISIGLGGAATALSPASSAAHACLMSVYILAATLGDSISQAAQTFLPSTLGRPAASFALCRTLLLTACGVGLFNCAWAGLIPAFAPWVFTTSSAVAELMGSMAGLMAASLIIHSASMGTEGLLLAGRDLRFLLCAYAANAACCYLSLQLMLRSGFGLHAVWLTLIQFHVVRFSGNLYRLVISPASPLKSTQPPSSRDDD